MSVDSEEEAKVKKHVPQPTKQKRVKKKPLDNRQKAKTDSPKSDHTTDKQTRTGKKSEAKTAAKKRTMTKGGSTGSSAHSDNVEGQGEVKVNVPDEYQYDSSDEEVCLVQTLVNE